MTLNCSMKLQKRIKAWTKSALAAVNEEAISIESEKRPTTKTGELVKEIE